MSSMKVIRTMVIVGVLACVLAVSGCTREKVRYEDRVTQVPYLVFRTPPAAAEVEVQKEYPVDQVTEDTSDPEVARAYVKTVEILKSEVRRLIDALEPYTEQALQEWSDEEREQVMKRIKEETGQDG